MSQPFSPLLSNFIIRCLIQHWLSVYIFKMLIILLWNLQSVKMFHWAGYCTQSKTVSKLITFIYNVEFHSGDYFTIVLRTNMWFIYVGWWFHLFKITLPAYVQKVLAIFTPFSHTLLAHAVLIFFIVCADLCIHIPHNNQNAVSWDIVNLNCNTWQNSSFFL